MFNLPAILAQATEILHTPEGAGLPDGIDTGSLMETSKADIADLGAEEMIAKIGLDGDLPVIDAFNR